MVEISVLKIENPSCLWCRVIEGPCGDAEATEEYNRLLTQMNLYYHSVTLDLRKLKPTSLEEGQVCVVYWSAIKSWCRAVVESIVVDSCWAHCFLVDHGEHLIIPSDQIRVALPDFLKLPFLARKFHLVRIKPITLRVSVDEKKAVPVLSTEWDSSATLYLHNLLQVTTNECLKCLGIRDATCVVHYGFPNSPKVFGSRLFCMVENFRNLSERDQPESRPHVIRSVLLISERNVCHIIGVLRYLMRTSALLPAELLSFAEGVHVVMPLYIKTASVFYGRILWKEVEDFQSMVSEMTSYYADKKLGAMDILEGGLYAVQEGEVFHRVKILSVPDRGDRVFSTIFVRFIDVGKEEEVKCHQILQLPEQFHSLPAQAVEIVLCQLKPVDAETNWHPKVTRAITQKIQGLQHRARVVFGLGNTVFVDPMVPGMKTVINEHNVQSEILNTGMGVSNPEHLNLLKALCQESKSNSCKEASHISGSGDGPTSPEVIGAEEEILAEAFRVTEFSLSGKVNGRTYRADLELEANLAVDGCCWEMKSNEPVLKLVKQQKGYWERLLRNKSIFVSYDMEHLEEDEGSAPNGLMFLEHLGDDNWNVSSESGSESD
ncbi:putative ATP-dependent RNA helicase TDRD12 [Collichthys lucidus]|uniref:RNA helicase n=1 Tax=Collichthys lucidus TaxID=240159 RepID=A0A4U5UJT4_COLLU|nr:putative ATP-dependent RNA helicase TDRD12 [Collichthys lucidus]TKS73795.1 putative ATP-dependent RNA helicase TDRD12 [Collichthys lucidus]